MSMLHPAASLYEDVTCEKEVESCFNGFKKMLEQLNIQLLTVREILKLNRKELIELAFIALTYECENIEEGADCKQFLYYISNEYKLEVLEKLSLDQLVDVVLTRPVYKVKYVPINTKVEPIGISFRPLGNLLFVRDQQITTQRGVVIGRTMTWARELEHMIMHQVFRNLKVCIIGEVPEKTFLEGGDFYIAKEDLAILGLGMRSTFSAAAYLMEKDLLGCERFALVFDETDFHQQRMHLDTFFNIINSETALMLDFEELSKISGKYINRRVEIYVKGGKALPTPSERQDKYGDYVLAYEFNQLETFLQSEGYTVVKASHEEQSGYMVNFLNIGKNRIIAVNKGLSKKLKNANVDVEVLDLDFDAVVKMYGAVHCATQVSRIVDDTQLPFLKSHHESVECEETKKIHHEI
jgi:arginine deiminase